MACAEVLVMCDSCLARWCRELSLEVMLRDTAEVFFVGLCPYPLGWSQSTIKVVSCSFSVYHFASTLTM